MKRLLKHLPPLTQRGDSGTIYIVFIMVIIIAASYVMVNGLSPEFDELTARENFQQSNGIDDPNDLLPPIPPTGSPEYLQWKKCAEEAQKGLTNEQIAKRGEIKIDPDCLSGN